jgi:hypothetical protein
MKKVGHAFLAPYDFFKYIFTLRLILRDAVLSRKMRA